MGWRTAPCGGDLAAATATAETTVSQALRLLRAFGVVTGRREGRNVVTLGAALVATPLGTRKDTTGRRTFGS